MKPKFNFILILFLFISLPGFSQSPKPFKLQSNDNKGDIFMTWNKNTPDSEMKDDIKGLSEHGITITHSNLKRNSRGEIIAIKVEYADRSGNKGVLEMNNQKPITTIKFFRQGDEIGFGEPSNADFIAGNQLFGDFSGANKLLKEYNFNFDADSLSTDEFNFQIPDEKSFGQNKSKIIIKKEGKKPLVIENGKVVEGGEDYAPEEIEKIKKDNSIEYHFGNEAPNFNFRFNPQKGNFESIKKQMQKMQEQIDKLMHQNENAPLEKSDEHSKESLKSQDTPENTKKESDKPKPNLKTQKA